MNVLIVGSGAREHTFAWKINKSNHDVNIFMTGPNVGCSKIVTPLSVDITNFELLKQSILANSINLVLIGPEIPLILGLADFISNDPDLIGVNVIGPSKKGSMLEG